MKKEKKLPQKFEAGEVCYFYVTEVDENGENVTKTQETSYKTENGVTDQTFHVATYSDGWKVLGVDKTNGQLMITTTRVIKFQGSISGSSEFHLSSVRLFKWNTRIK